MYSYQKKFLLTISKYKFIFALPFLINMLAFNPDPVKSGMEFQWDNNDGYRKLKWYQRNSRKNSRNKIFFFFRPGDRKTGLLKINIKIPKNFKSNLNSNKINLCTANVGGVSSKTRCLKDIPADIEINKDDRRINIYPLVAIPSSKETYAVVFNVINPNRSGLYQFHSFGTSSGNIPVSSYLGSWTIKVDQL